MRGGRGRGPVADLVGRDAAVGVWRRAADRRRLFAGVSVVWRGSRASRAGGKPGRRHGGVCGVPGRGAGHQRPGGGLAGGRAGVWRGVSDGRDVRVGRRFRGLGVEAPCPGMTH
ncbi:hypothetical protein G6F22_015410 [Rhizopus arrhizus]|nr:hypothetical protein G6F22_015410 [Rhizopus arrhizus]